MREAVGDGILGLVEPVVEGVLDAPEVLDGGLLQNPGLVLAISGQRQLLDHILDIGLAQLKGIRQMEVVALHTVVTPSRLLVMTMLCYAELCYFLSVFTPVHLFYNPYPEYFYWVRPRPLILSGSTFNPAAYGY